MKDDLPSALETLAQAEARQRKENAWLRGIGMVTRPVVYVALGGLLWLFSPEDVFHTPFAQLTLSDLFRFVGITGVAFGLIYYAFNPSPDPKTKEAWGGLGVILLAAAVGGAFYLFKTS